MLIECGFVRAVAPDGTEYTFTPSLARIASLGDPRSIVKLYADLHGPRAEIEAGYVLACLCDQDDPTPLIGWIDSDGLRNPGTMPASEQVILARHLMHHGIIGKDCRRNGWLAFGKGRDIGVNRGFHLFGRGHGNYSGK